jgi:hypothetical protein
MQAISGVACRLAFAPEITQARHNVQIQQDAKNEACVASERPPKYDKCEWWWFVTEILLLLLQIQREVEA